MHWTPEQYNELTERYRHMSDAELRRLASVPEDLTEMAEEVLGKEIATRKLNLAPEPVEEIEEAAVDGEETQPEPDGALWLSYAQTAPPQCIFDFESARKVRNARAFLWESGRIPTYALQPEARSLALQGPRLVVLPQDAERAARILSQPIPDHIANEPDVVVEDFVTPACPHCGADDPVLTAFEPTNHWLCEACEQEWDELEPLVEE